MKSFEIALIGLGLLILERIEDMRKELTDAIADLNTEVADETNKLASIKAYVQGVPELVAAAVATALDNAGVEEAAAAAQVEQARQTLQSSVTDTLSAIDANTPSSDTGGGSTTSGGAATDLGNDGEQTPPGEGTIGTASGPIATPDNPPPAPDESSGGDSGGSTAGTGDASGGTGGTSGADTGATGGGDASGGAPAQGDQTVQEGGEPSV